VDVLMHAVLCRNAKQCPFNGVSHWELILSGHLATRSTMDALTCDHPTMARYSRNNESGSKEIVRDEKETSEPSSLQLIDDNYVANRPTFVTVMQVCTQVTECEKISLAKIAYCIQPVPHTIGHRAISDNGLKKHTTFSCN